VTDVSLLVLEHVRHPRNAGAFAPDEPHVASGSARAPEGIDRVHLYLKLEGPTVRAVRFRASGCPALIASASLFTERATGAARVEVGALDAETLAAALELPQHQVSKAALVIEAFVDACTKWDAREDERSQDPR
jgi:NifU-like protein involved in Fe-S cluster formation